MSSSLFAHIALRFSAHPEDLATEALGYVLRQSSSARAAVRDVVAQLGVQLPHELTYRNQANGEDEARPDLIGLTLDGEQPLIIEAKYWAGLTDNQPTTYLERLPAGRGLLLIVVPRARIEHVWHEMLRRCDLARKDVSPAKCGLAEARVASVGNARMAILSWPSLLAAIAHRLDADDDRQVREDVAQLRGLCERMDSDAFLPVSAEELSAKTYRRVVEFGAIIDDVAATLVARKIASTKGCRSAAGNGYYGRYLLLRDVGVFILCDVRKWMKYAATPLWLSVYGARWRSGSPQAARSALASLECAIPPRMFVAGDGFPTVPLFVPAGVERAAVVAKVVEQVEIVGALIARLAEPASSPGAPPPDDNMGP